MQFAFEIKTDKNNFICIQCADKEHYTSINYCNLNLCLMCFVPCCMWSIIM